MKLTLDLTPGELVVLTEELSSAQEQMEDEVNQFLAAGVPLQHPEFQEKRFALTAVTKVLGQVALGGVRSDSRRGG